MQDMYEQIQSYLDNSMPLLERNTFEKRLLQDEELRQELELVKELETQLGDQELRNFRTKLKSIVSADGSQIINEERPAKKLKIYSILSMAATILFLIGAYWLSHNYTSKANLTSIADKYFVPYPANIQSRGEEINKDIYEDYLAGQYENAAVNLEKFGIKNSDNEAKLFSAISYISIGKLDKALSLLESVQKSPHLTNKINYYKGIIYLKQNDSQKAISAFKLINSGDKFLFDRAQEILLEIT